MREWAYKATEKRRSLEDTRRLVDEHGLLARSAHRKDRSAVPFVREVEVGDTLHFYYRSGRDLVPLGSYRVLPGGGPRFPSIEGAALVRVAPVAENEVLLSLLRAAPSSKKATGYKVDPVLGDFTGFRLERLADVSPPAFHVWQFPSQGTLTGKRVEAPAPEALLSRITHDTTVMAGRACVRGMRVTVGTVLGLMAAGHAEAEILAEYPYLEPLDLRAALAYAAYRLEEREIPVEAA